jgi:hypothetical protein
MLGTACEDFLSLQKVFREGEQQITAEERRLAERKGCQRCRQACVITSEKRAFHSTADRLLSHNSFQIQIQMSKKISEQERQTDHASHRHAALPASQPSNHLGCTLPFGILAHGFCPTSTYQVCHMSIFNTACKTGLDFKRHDHNESNRERNIENCPHSLRARRSQHQAQIRSNCHPIPHPCNLLKSPCMPLCCQSTSQQ